LIILLISNLTFAQSEHNWERTNPGGGGAFGTIGAGPTGIIVAGSDLSGPYISSNRGQSWTAIGSAHGLTTTHISGIGFHPTNGNIFYLGTEEGIFRSTDAGNSVTQVLANGYITDIKISPANPAVGYAAYHPAYDSDQGKIYKTTDNGLSWMQISTNLPAGLRLLEIEVHPQDEDTLYVLSGAGRFACSAAEVYKSTDGGITWRQIGSNLGEIMDIAIHPQSPEKIYLTTLNADCNEPYYWTDLDGRFYSSNNGGSTWTSLANHTGVIWVKQDLPSTIRLIDPREPYPWNSLSGTWESMDNGNTWQKIGKVEDWDYGYQGDAFWSYSSSFDGPVKTLGTDLSDPDTLFWANSQWVYGTFDGGTIFNNLFTDEVTSGWWQSRGVDNIVMFDIAVSEANPDQIYAGFFDIGLWRSSDHGESWQSCNDSTFTGNWEGFGGNGMDVVADPTRANVVWATLQGDLNDPSHLIRSNQSGEKGSWVLSNSGLPQDNVISGISVDRNSPDNNRVMFVTAGGSVYKSTDDGASWTLKLANDGLRFTAIDYFDGNLVYAGGENGLRRSFDGGENWSNIGLPEMSGSQNSPLWEYGWEGVFCITTDPQNSSWIYVAAFGHGKGLWRSTDAGDGWEKMITDDFMRCVAISPRNSDILYATSSSAYQAGGYYPGSGGVSFSDDGGQTWSSANDGMSWQFAIPVAIDNSPQSSVFVGSPGTGFQKALVPNPTDNTNTNSDTGTDTDSDSGTDTDSDSGTDTNTDDDTFPGCGGWSWSR
jgi:photosystem II stability/assembly factor-like uncharacterized protein